MTELDVEIDELGSSVVGHATGNVLPTVVVPFKLLTFRHQAQLTAWRFDWLAESKQRARSVVALLVHGSRTIQGMMSFEPAEGFVFVHLVESAPHNVGSNKLYSGVPGNLFAYVCARSFALGSEGFVAFEAKSVLIEHYKVSLGARQLGSSNRMMIETPAALRLVKQYYKDSDQWPS